MSVMSSKPAACSLHHQRLVLIDIGISYCVYQQPSADWRATRLNGRLDSRATRLARNSGPAAVFCRLDVSRVQLDASSGHYPPFPSADQDSDLFWI
jgi:hypothetical protein